MEIISQNTQEVRPFHLSRQPGAVSWVPQPPPSIGTLKHLVKVKTNKKQNTIKITAKNGGINNNNKAMNNNNRIKGRCVYCSGLSRMA